MMTTTLHNNRSILMCQNSVYISKEWWYLSNQDQFRIERLNWKRVECLASAFRVWKSKWADDTSRFQKIIEHCRRARKYWKRKLNNISGWLEVLVYSLKRSRAWKTYNWMSVDIGKNHRIQNGHLTILLNNRREL